jgi:hypothetical protein
MRYSGDVDLDKKIVRINKKKSLKKGGGLELLDTLMHEKTHILHPKMHEATVYKKMSKLKKGYAKRYL